MEVRFKGQKSEPSEDFAARLGVWTMEPGLIGLRREPCQRTMAKFCFVIHPTSFEDVVRYEPGAAGKGRPIVAKILEWMPAYAAAHLTGIRAADGRETEGWFVAAPLLPAQMLELPREAVYERILKAIAIGVDLGAEIAGLGAFTGIVGDAGVTIAARAPIPVTTGNSLTIAAGVRSLFRGAAEMGIDPAGATAVVVGATGSIGSVSYPTKD